ncbi:hypothetical protein HDU88_005710 [Geranomyces variabilis]|nr:hypothetical protein HDU88_005710 [Geranomyces variabilis]
MPFSKRTRSSQSAGSSAKGIRAAVSEKLYNPTFFKGYDFKSELSVVDYLKERIRAHPDQTPRASSVRRDLADLKYLSQHHGYVYGRKKSDTLYRTNKRNSKSSWLEDLKKYMGSKECADFVTLAEERNRVQGVGVMATELKYHKVATLNAKRDVESSDSESSGISSGESSDDESADLHQRSAEWVSTQSLVGAVASDSLSANPFGGPATPFKKRRVGQNDQNDAAMACSPEHSFSALEFEWTGGSLVIEGVDVHALLAKIQSTAIRDPAIAAKVNDKTRPFEFLSARNCLFLSDTQSLLRKPFEQDLNKIRLTFAGYRIQPQAAPELDDLVAQLIAAEVFEPRNINNEVAAEAKLLQKIFLHVGMDAPLPISETDFIAKYTLPHFATVMKRGLEIQL